MPTLGDVIRQQAGQADAPPGPPGPTPPSQGGPTLGDLVRQGSAPPPDQPAPDTPPPPSPDAGGAAGSVVGKSFAGPWAKGYQFPDPKPRDPGPYATDPEFSTEPPQREPTWGETAGLTAARVLPPIAAGAVATPLLTPVGGVPAAALAATLGDVVAQRYEKSHGLRREVRPYESIVSGIAGAIPGGEIAPEAGLLTRAGVRAAEGAAINTGATVAETGLEEHRLPTLGDLSRSALTGAAFGGVAGTAEHGVHAYVGGRAERAAPDVAGTEGVVPPLDVSTPPPDVTEGGPRMVTQPGETIGGTPAPEGQFVGPPRYRVTAADGRTVTVDDPDVALRTHDAFGGHDAGATFETVGPEEAKPPLQTIPIHRYDDVVQMSADDLDTAATNARDYERNAAVDVFGPEEARRYERLQRTANSVMADHDRTRAASDEIARMEAPLSQAQQARLFGFGEEGYNAEELRRIADAARDYSPEGVANLDDAYLLNTVGRELLTGKLTDNPVSTIRLHGALRELSNRGYDKSVIYDAVARRAAREGVSPGDAQELLDGTLRDLQTARARPTPPQPQLGGPQAQIAGPQQVEAGAPPPPGGEAPPPAGGTDALGLEPEVRFPPPVFKRAPGLREAFGGEPVPPAVERPPERLAGEHAAVDRFFADRPEAERQALHDIIDRNADDIAERARQQQPVERTRALADELVLDPEQLWKRGKGAPILTAEQKLSVLGLVKSHMGQIADLQAARDALPADAPQAARDEAALRLKIKQQELTYTIAAFEGDKAETGRALSILQHQVKQLDTGDPKFIRAALREGIPVDQIASIIHQIPEDDVVGRYRNLLALRKPSTWGQSALSYMTTNILSSPKTPIKKAMFDALAIAHDIMLPPVAGPYERWMPEFAGGKKASERTVLAGESGKRLVGLLAGREEAWKRMMMVIREGFTPEQAAGYAPTRRELFESRGPVLRGVANYAGRAMAAAEAYTRTLAEHMELAGSAYTTAWKEARAQGLEGKAAHTMIADRMAELMQDPEFNANARRYAERRVFREHGKLDTSLLRLAQDFPIMRLVIPLVRIPIAAFRHGVQASPAGFATKIGRAEGRFGAQMRGEAALGTMVAAYLMYKTVKGDLDGSGPSNPADFDAWYAEGHRPNSIRFGDHHIGFHVAPWALEASVIANARDAYIDLAKKDGLSAGQFASMLGRREAKSLLQQSTLRGVAEMMQGITDTDENTANKFAGSLMSSFVPYSGLQRSIKQAVDPTLRKATTPLEYVEAGIPGLSSRLQPRVRATGEEIHLDQPGGALGRALLPFDVSTDRTNPIRSELERLGVRLTIPSAAKVGPKKLAPEEQTALVEAKGRATVTALQRLFDNPSYRRIPDTPAGKDQQARAAHREIGRTRTQMTRIAAGLVARGKPVTLDALMPAR
jgi:hypothetical protein